MLDFEYAEFYSKIRYSKFKIELKCKDKKSFKLYVNLKIQSLFKFSRIWKGFNVKSKNINILDTKL